MLARPCGYLMASWSLLLLQAEELRLAGAPGDATASQAQQNKGAPAAQAPAEVSLPQEVAGEILPSGAGDGDAGAPVDMLGGEQLSEGETPCLSHLESKSASIHVTQTTPEATAASLLMVEKVRGLWVMTKEARGPGVCLRWRQEAALPRIERGTYILGVWLPLYVTSDASSRIAK